MKFPIFYFLLNLLVAGFVYIDVDKFKKQGIKVSPIICAAPFLILSFLLLPFYWTIRYALWKVQVKVLQEPETSKDIVKRKIIFRFVKSAIVFVLLSLLFGCHSPFLANFVHSKVKVGMTVEEIEKVLLKYHSDPSYTIKLLNESTQKICAASKLAYDTCDRFKDSDGCIDKFFKYTDDCEKKINTYQEFKDVVDQVVNKKIGYTVYEAKISVFYMGPGFLHNVFDIEIDREGKVSQISGIRRYD